MAALFISLGHVSGTKMVGTAPSAPSAPVKPTSVQSQGFACLPAALPPCTIQGVVPAPARLMNQIPRRFYRIAGVALETFKGLLVEEATV
jgi:hypothetical protein